MCASIKKIAPIEPIVKPVVAYVGRRINQKSTGIASNDILIESTFSILPNNVFSNGFDNVVKNELKEVFKNHNPIKILGIVVGHRNVKLDEKIISTALVSSIGIEKSADISINNIIKKSFKMYNEPQRDEL